MSSVTTTFDEFKSTWLGQGFDEVIERQWAPGTVLATHTHPFAVEAMVVQGEMWLNCATGMLHLRAGDRFSLDAEVPHDERYGDAGATYWVARRNLKA